MVKKYSPASVAVLKEIRYYCIVVLCTTFIGSLGNLTFVGMSVGLIYLLIQQLLQLYRFHRKLEKEQSIKTIDVSTLLITNTQIEEIILILQRDSQRAEKRLQKTKNQSRQFLEIFNNLPFGIVIVDKQGAIGRINKTMRSITGVQKSDKNLLLTMLIRHPTFVHFFADNKTMNPIIFTQSGKNNKDIQVERIHGGNIFDLVVFRDVSYHERQQQVQKRFIADASHELQSPLTIIRGNAELAQIGQAGNDNQYLAEIITQVDSMSDLIRSLLTLARIDENQPPHQQQWIDPSNIITMAVHSAQKDTQTHIQINCTVEKDLHLYINKSDLYIIVRNLLDNAIKYSPDNSKIQINWRKGKWKKNRGMHKIKKRGYAILEIIDEGIGIPKNEVDNVVKRFYQLRTDSNDCGHGLGLSIVQGLLAMYNARLFITSTPGKGSRIGCIFSQKTCTTITEKIITEI